MIFNFMKSNSWMWGDIGCTYYGFMGIFLGNVMILTMLSICVDLFFETNLLHYGLFLCYNIVPDFCCLT